MPVKRLCHRNALRITIAAFNLLTWPGVATCATTVSLGADYAKGNYGSTETTTTQSIPLAIKHETGRWIWRASLPYVRTSGEFNRDQGSSQESSPQTQSGTGDLTIGAMYSLLAHPLGYGVDLGAKAKLATADKNNSLITTGKNDYSIQIDAFHSFPAIALFVTLGYTIKGEPEGVVYRNPAYFSFGLNKPLTSNTTLGAAFDYRQKLTPTGADISEMSVFYSIKINPSDKLQLYAVRGLSDGSPDFAGGLVLSRRY